MPILALIIAKRYKKGLTTNNEISGESFFVDRGLGLACQIPPKENKVHNTYGY